MSLHAFWLTSSIGYQIAQVRVVFSIPDNVAEYLRIGPTSANPLPPYLAYVEWFTTFKQKKEPAIDMWLVSHAKTETGERQSEVVRLDSIIRSCHLLPIWGSRANLSWTRANILEQCSHFYLNDCLDSHCYKIL